MAQMQITKNKAIQHRGVSWAEEMLEKFQKLKLFYFNNSLQLPGSQGDSMLIAEARAGSGDSKG